MFKLYKQRPLSRKKFLKTPLPRGVERQLMKGLLWRRRQIREASVRPRAASSSEIPRRRWTVRRTGRWAGWAEESAPRQTGTVVVVVVVSVKREAEGGNKRWADAGERYTQTHTAAHKHAHDWWRRRRRLRGFRIFNGPSVWGGLISVLPWTGCAITCVAGVAVLSRLVRFSCAVFRFRSFLFLFLPLFSLSFFLVFLPLHRIR